MCGDEEMLRDLDVGDLYNGNSGDGKIRVPSMHIARDLHRGFEVRDIFEIEKLKMMANLTVRPIRTCR